MLNNKNIGLLVGLLFLFIPACNKTDLHEGEKQPIECLVLENDTKGTPAVSNLSIQTSGFGMYAYWEESDAFFSSVDASRIYLENSRVKYVSGSWVTGAYWPAGKKLNFFGYAPYQSDIDATDSPIRYMDHGGGVTTYPKLVVIPPEDISKQMDLCVSSPTLNYSASDGPVPFSFEHAMARIRIYVNINGSGVSYKVKGLTLYGVASRNTLTFSTAPGTPFVWDACSAADGSYVFESGQLLSTSIKRIADLTDETGLDRYSWIHETAEGELYLVPQTLTSYASISLEIGEYDGDGVLVNTFDRIVSLPSGSEWLGGKTYCYKYTLTP